MPEIMPRWESVAPIPYHKTFMSTIKKIKRAIATWLLETDSESEDIDHEENQSAAPSTEDTLPTAVPNLDRIVPIYSHKTGAIIRDVSHAQSNPSAEASHTGINPRTPVPPYQHRNSGPVRFEGPSADLSTSDQKNALPLSTARLQGIKRPTLELSKENVPHGFTRWPDIDLSDPVPLTVYIPLETQPEPEARRGIDDGVVFTTLSNFPGGWNGWPSGLFAIDVSFEDFKQTKKLQVNWAMRNNGGDPEGSETASTIRDGKISNRRCLGVLRCENPECKVAGAEFDTEELAQWHRAELEKEEERMRAHEVTCPKPRMLSRHAGKRRALDDTLAEPSAVRPGSPDKDTAPPTKRSRRKLTDGTDPDL
ncbi:hypothetical protein EDD85DRAFT_795065 [Armillaria nabsnona]|nr:hypothetical protein EDD85DRAFT_795065 [Armillaria nabsnona]